MVKKLFMFPFVLLLFLLPMAAVQAASTAEITSVRTATRNDANIPFVRTVLEVEGKVTPRLFIDKSGKYVTVTLPNAKIAKNVDKKYSADRNVISRITLNQRSSGTDVEFKLPNAITKEDLNVFTLPGVDNKKIVRVVVDINDKSGKIKQWRHWNDSKAGINNKRTSTSSLGVPTYPRTRSYKVTKGLKDKVICIDPGHGGTDVGAIGKKFKEKDLTLAISKKMAEALTKAGAKVIMTRTKDVDVYAPYDGAVEELQARCNIANVANADAFVSVHIDSFTSPDAKGITTYYNSKTPHDYGLAKYVHGRNMKATNFPSRGVRQANFYVLLHTNMPAVLMELGFISNPAEEQALNTERQQESFAEGLVKGLTDYFNNGGK